MTTQQFRLVCRFMLVMIRLHVNKPDFPERRLQMRLTEEEMLYRDIRAELDE